jgi:nitroimidazol reductase NimA-like FMN-containing flavoprotein (pyridoxamine 5'-phosphate oxidase superfamily)
MIGKLSDKEVEMVLAHNFLGRIGCHDEGKTYVVPVTYVYDGKDIIIHSMPGTKIQMMRRNPQVCFEVDEVKDFANWKSVILQGEYQEYSNVRDRYRAVRYFVDRTLSLKISETAVPPEGFDEENYSPVNYNDARPVIYRIVILEKSGRYEKE